MSMKSAYKQIVMASLLLCAALPVAAAEIEGVKLADKVRVGASEGGPELLLNGVGVRTRLVFKVYVGALYLQQKRSTSEAVLDDAGPKRVLLHMLRDVTADQLFSALNDGLKGNHTADQLAKLEAQTQAFEAIFKKLQQAKTGDVILLDFVPGTGMRVTVNGDVKGAIAGAEFYTALLRVWLGEKPAEASLKKAMLGG
jgi:Chalcone isomerase-like